MDIWLSVVIGITQLALGAMGVYVSLKPPKSEHHLHWIGVFVAVGLIGIALTAWLARIGSREQAKNTEVQQKIAGDIQTTKEQLLTSRIEQARMSGHLEAIQTILDTFAKAGFPGMAQLASAIKGLNANHQQGIGPSTAELCANTHALAKEMRDLKATYDANEQAITLSQFQQEVVMNQQGKTKEERDAVWKQQMQQRTLRDENEGRNFSGLAVEGKYYKDLLINRFSPEKRDFFVTKNTEADMVLTGQIYWAHDEYKVAAYLDELAYGVCPPPKAK